MSSKLFLKFIKVVVVCCFLRDLRVVVSCIVILILSFLLLVGLLNVDWNKKTQMKS